VQGREHPCLRENASHVMQEAASAVTGARACVLATDRIKCGNL